MLIRRTHQNPPEAAIQIPLGGGLFTLVDGDAIEMLDGFHWSATKSRFCVYATAKITVAGQRRRLRMHRLLTGAPDGIPVHHVNHNSLDNRLVNLQVVSPQYHFQLHHGL